MLTNSIEHEPELDLSRRPRLAPPLGSTSLSDFDDPPTREMRVADAPWVDDADIIDEPNTPVPQSAPPRHVEGGAAAPAGSVTVAPKPLLTVPRPPTAAGSPLPSVIAVGSPITRSASARPTQRDPDATMPPRAHRGPIAVETTVDTPRRDDRWLRRTWRSNRPLVAFGAIALAAVTVVIGMPLMRPPPPVLPEAEALPAFLNLPAIPTPSDVRPSPSPQRAHQDIFGSTNPPPVSEAPPAPESPIAIAPATPLAQLPALDSAAPPAQFAALDSAPLPAAQAPSEAPPSAAPTPSPTAATSASPASSPAAAPSVPTPPPAIAVPAAPAPERAAVAKRAAPPPPKAQPTVPAPSPAPRSSSAPPGAATPVRPLTTYTYTDSDFFAVATAPKRVTDIVLQPGEKLVTQPTAGDASLWVITVVDSVQRDEPQQHVYVKPLRSGTSTNLAIATTRRTYHLELTSSSTAPYMAAVAWRYPLDDAERRRREQDLDSYEHRTTTQIADPKSLHFDYRMVATGAPSWKPSMVFDDGKRTFIRFPTRVTPERSPVLLVLRSGAVQSAKYVNYRITNDLYVVDRVIDVAELRMPASLAANGEAQVVRITREGAQ